MVKTAFEYPLATIGIVNTTGGKDFGMVVGTPTTRELLLLSGALPRIIASNAEFVPLYGVQILPRLDLDSVCFEAGSDPIGAIHLDENSHKIRAAYWLYDAMVDIQTGLIHFGSSRSPLSRSWDLHWRNRNGSREVLLSRAFTAGRL